MICNEMIYEMADMKSTEDMILPSFQWGLNLWPPDTGKRL